MVSWLDGVYAVFSFFGISQSLANFFLFVVPALAVLALVFSRRRD